MCQIKCFTFNSCWMFSWNFILFCFFFSYLFILTTRRQRECCRLWRIHSTVQSIMPNLTLEKCLYQIRWKACNFADCDEMYRGVVKWGMGEYRKKRWKNLCDFFLLFYKIKHFIKEIGNYLHSLYYIFHLFIFVSRFCFAVLFYALYFQSRRCLPLRSFLSAFLPLSLPLSHTLHLFLSLEEFFLTSSLSFHSIYFANNNNNNNKNHKTFSLKLRLFFILFHLEKCIQCELQRMDSTNSAVCQDF